MSVVSSPSSSGRVSGVLSILIWSCQWCPLHPHLVGQWCPLHPHLVVSVVSSPSSSGRVSGVLPIHPRLVVSVVSSPSSSGRVSGVLSILVWSCQWCPLHPHLLPHKSTDAIFSPASSEKFPALDNYDIIIQMYILLW